VKANFRGRGRAGDPGREGHGAIVVAVGKARRSHNRCRFARIQTPSARNPAPKPIMAGA
jgi:hypothetical protein